MWPDRVSNPGPLTYESGVLPIALRGPAGMEWNIHDNLYSIGYNLVPEPECNGKYHLSQSIPCFKLCLHL